MPSKPPFSGETLAVFSMKSSMSVESIGRPGQQAMSESVEKQALNIPMQICND